MSYINNNHRAYFEHVVSLHAINDGVFIVHNVDALVTDKFRYDLVNYSDTIRQLIYAHAYCNFTLSLVLIELLSEKEFLIFARIIKELE